MSTTTQTEGTCNPRLNIDNIRTTMNEIRSSSEININIKSLLLSVTTIVVFTLTIFVYPIIHIIYKRSSTSSLSFTMYICVFVLLLVIFGPLYGWVSSMK